jgi:DNA (cytosine-5)-methyltransferase 1
MPVAFENVLYNHVCTSLSELDMEMVRSVPPGGNWKDIPLEVAIKSARLIQIRASGGRTTYYGRLDGGLPSYTISTYFNRPGNGTFIHPRQDRLISLREAARLQSFPDSFRFMGSTTSMYKQIGNAVPPLLARALGEKIPPGLTVDLFSGAGGLSQGLSMAGHQILLGSDFNRHMCDTYTANHPSAVVTRTDMTDTSQFQSLIDETENELRGRSLGMVCGGPPCQGFSTAGKWQAGDSRNRLYIPFLEFVESLQPEYVLIENVLGIKSFDNGTVLEDILFRLKSSGYSVDCFGLLAEQYGVPQRRRRIFITGNRSGDVPEMPAPVFPAIVRGRIKNGGLKSQSPVSVNEAISDLPEIHSGGGTHESHYDENEAKSDYQLLIRGRISWHDFLGSRAGQD